MSDPLSEMVERWNRAKKRRALRGTRQIEREITKHFGRFGQAINRQLERYDWDVDQIPQSVWQRYMNELGVYMTLLLMDKVTRAAQRGAREFGQRYNVDAIQQTAAPIVARRWKWINRSIRVTTKNRLRPLKRKRGEKWDEYEYRVFGPPRRKLILDTERKQAETVGLIMTASELRKSGFDVDLIWTLGPTCDHCNLCPILENQPWLVWGKIHPPGAPLHVRCCCNLKILGGTEQQLRRQGRLNRRPNIPLTRKLFRDRGIKDWTNNVIITTVRTSDLMGFSR